jgi:PAS domain S-box-containing protein
MQKKVRIIHLEDTSSDAELVVMQLEKSGMAFEYMLVSQSKEFEDAIQNFNADIILSDHSLPSMSSADAFRILKDSGREIPFILVTAAVSEEFAVSMIKAGIDDYLLKDKLHLLPNAINTALNKALSEKNRQEHLRALIRQEKKFRALLENSYESISLADKNLNIIYRSPSAVRVTGYTPEELDSASLFDRTHPEDIDHLRHLFAQSLKSPDISIKGNFRVKHKNGNYIWLNTTISNLLSDDNVNAIVINYRDVTENKTYEAELLRSSKHFRALIENIADAIVLLDAQGCIVYLSPSVTPSYFLTLKAASFT